MPGDHGLWDLLFKTPYNLPFQYYCPPEERRRRLYPQATIPSDERDRELEARALVQAEQEWAEVLRLEEVRREADRPAASEPTSMTGSEAGGGKGGRPAQVKGRARGRDGQGAVNGSRLQRPLNIPLLTPDGRPKFYHGKTCVAMTATELREGEDSDDESDTEEWLVSSAAVNSETLLVFLNSEMGPFFSVTANGNDTKPSFLLLQRDCVERLEERPSLCPEERDFMLQWNLYLHQNTLHADADVPAACSSFAREHGAQLADARGPFRRCFMAHLCNLWKFRLLTPVQFQEVLAAVKAAGPAAAS